MGLLRHGTFRSDGSLPPHVCTVQKQKLRMFSKPEKSSWRRRKDLSWRPLRLCKRKQKKVVWKREKGLPERRISLYVHMKLFHSKMRGGIPRIELGTSRTLSENHATRPNALYKKINYKYILNDSYYFSTYITFSPYLWKNREVTQLGFEPTTYD